MLLSEIDYILPVNRLLPEGSECGWKGQEGNGTSTNYNTNVYFLVIHQNEQHKKKKQNT